MSVLICPCKEAAALAKALGLPDTTVEFSLHAKVNDVVTVQCTYLVRDKLDDLVETIGQMKTARFVLVEEKPR